MGIGDADIVRVYRCDDLQYCGAEIAYKEKVSDKWRKKCPFCKKHTLYLHEANASMSILTSVNNPTTLGGLSDQNKLRKEKEGQPWQDGTGHKPFWRKKKRIDFNVLKNPKNYIEKGYV